MAESKIRDENYFQVSGWMLNRLGLKGAALEIYAIIYGFSQDGENSFTGSLQYLSDFTNTSKPTVIKALKELVEKGYVLKSESMANGVQFNTYKANLQVVKKLYWGSKDSLLGGSKESLPGGSQDSLPNNKTSDNKGSDNKEIRNNYQQIADLYNQICVSLPKIRALNETRKKAIKARLNTYSEEDFRLLFEKAESSDFLKGKNGRNWSADFDWLLTDRNMARTLEGKYDNRGGGDRGANSGDSGEGQHYGTYL